MLIYKLPPPPPPPPPPVPSGGAKKPNTTQAKAAAAAAAPNQRIIPSVAAAAAATKDKSNPDDFKKFVSTGKLSFLKHQRCIHMTMEQYNDRDHINENMCYKEFDASMYDIEKKIIENLNTIKRNIQTPFKSGNDVLLPLPIYVSIAKIISWDNKYVLKRMFADVSYDFSGTFFEKYTFKGMMKIIIYIPNLMKNNGDKGDYYNYYPSLYTYTNQNKWMEYMTSKDSYFLKALDNKIKISDKARYDNLLKRSLNNICDDFGCVSQGAGEDLNHIKGEYGGGVYMPTKCLQFKEYASKYYMNRDFNELYLKSSEEIKKIYEDIKKEAEKEATPEEGELEQEEKEEISRNAISETLGYAGREGKEGNKINGSYNNTIINDIRLRTEPGKSFPGIQDITFNMFKINEKYSKFSNFFHYMPWGNKLLNNEYVLNSGSTFNFEDSKYLLKNLVVPVYLKFKSIDDRYYMEFNNEGVLTLYNNNGTPNTIIQAAYGKNLKDTKNRKIIFDGLNGVLHIQGEPSENNDTVSISYPNSKTNKQPCSLILDTSSGNLGKLKIYDLGFNVIFNN
jgi:hypothetical protein